MPTIPIVLMYNVAFIYTNSTNLLVHYIYVHIKINNQYTYIYIYALCHTSIWFWSLINVNLGHSAIKTSNRQDTKGKYIKGVYWVKEVHKRLLYSHFRRRPVKAILLLIFPVTSDNSTFITALMFLSRNGKTQINNSHINRSLSANHHQIGCSKVSMDKAHLYQINQSFSRLSNDWLLLPEGQHWFIFTKWMMPRPPQRWMYRPTWDKLHGHVWMSW